LFISAVHERAMLWKGPQLESINVSEKNVSQSQYIHKL